MRPLALSAFVGPLALAAVLGLGGPAGAQTNPEGLGHDLVRRNCGMCHAVGRADSSEHASAPPFRRLNKRYPLVELIGACHEYVQKVGRRMTFEWTAISGQNDTPEQAHALGRLLRGLKCHVNIIPLNPTVGYAGDPSATLRIGDFIDILATYGVPATIRIRRGIDIAAGCGQLKSDVLRKTQHQPASESE